MAGLGGWVERALAGERIQIRKSDAIVELRPAVLQSRIFPFGYLEATLASELFNKTGRRRGSRFDCLIAATAILAEAKLASLNQSDFNVFVPHGLGLAVAAALPPPPRPLN